MIDSCGEFGLTDQQAYVSRDLPAAKERREESSFPVLAEGELSLSQVFLPSLLRQKARTSARRRPICTPV